jgi:endo-1,4-beta-xylanase
VASGGTASGGARTTAPGGASTLGGAASGGAGRGGAATTGAGGATGGAAGAAGGATSSGGTGTSTRTGKAWELRKFVGNITTAGKIDTNGLVFARHWDQITPENEGKWPSVQGSLHGAYNWSRLDAIYAYAQQNGLIFKENSFVWGTGMFSGVITEADVKDWMTQFCKRYPNTDLIDVVNEPPPHTTPNYTQAMGGGNGTTWQWITNAFKWARAACPNAVLILNDYYNVEYAADHQHFLSIVKTIQAAGAPIDAIGVEAHSLKSSGVTFSAVQSRMAALHTETGLPIYISEFDIDLADDDQQLRYFQQYVPYFLSTDYIRGTTLWGWIYGSTWVAYSGLVKSGAPRPSMTWLMQTLGRPVP